MVPTAKEEASSCDPHAKRDPDPDVREPVRDGADVVWRWRGAVRVEVHETGRPSPVQDVDTREGKGAWKIE